MFENLHHCALVTRITKQLRNEVSGLFIEFEGLYHFESIELPSSLFFGLIDDGKFACPDFLSDLVRLGNRSPFEVF